MSYIKEEHAEKYWCPMVRVSSAGEPASNAAHNKEAPDYARCRGLKCMMWRWSEHVSHMESDGYCGLAGVPAFLP